MSINNAQQGNNTTNGTDTTFKRNLGLIEAVSIGIGGMIGGGIFAVIGLVIGLAGYFVYLSLIYCTIIAIFTGYNYAIMAKAYPSSGAGYTFVRVGFGDKIGGIVGWMLWFGYVAAIALYAMSFGLYVSYFFPYNWKIYSLLLIFLFTVINFKGVKETGFIENLIVGAKVGILLIFIIGGLLVTNVLPSFQHSLSSIHQIGTSQLINIFLGGTLIFIAYEGFELIATSAEEIRNPEKNITYAIFISIAIVSAVYFFTAIISVSVADPGTISSSEGPLIIAAKQFLGTFGEILLGFGGVFATASALNASLYGASRVLYAISRDGIGPYRLTNIHSKHATPHNSIILTALAATGLTLIGVLSEVSTLSSLFFLFIFLAVNLGAVKLELKGELKNNVILSFMPVILIIFSIYLLLQYLMTPLLWLLLFSAVGVAYITTKINLRNGARENKK